MAEQSRKVVLITGCSSGVGLATAVMLAKDADKRFRVYATMRNLAKKEALEKEGSDVLEKTLFVQKLDVTSEEQIENVVDDLLAKEGKIDVLVNNAAFVWFGPTEFHQSDNMESMFSTNVYGPIKLIRKLLPSWKKSGSGQAITVTSIAGILGFAFSAVYSATKFAVEGFSEALAMELHEYPNIRINLVEPGPIYTPFAAKAINENQESLKRVDDATKAFMENYMAKFSKLVEESGQTGEEIGKVILEAITDSKRPVRYMTNPKLSDMVLAKCTDLTGEKPLKALTDHFFKK